MVVNRRRETSSSDQRLKSTKRPTISIIGAGRLGTALARALAQSGYTIKALMARSLRHAKRAAELIGTHPLALTSRQLNQLPLSDILFITTPDDSVAKVADELAATINSRRLQIKGQSKRPGQTALHTSGALSSAALESLREVGFATGSMHPLVSVSDSIHGAQSLRSAFFCVEGSRAAVLVARQMVRVLGAESFSISAEDKALYHAAAVMASGHTTALFDIAMEMLTRCGLPPSRARKVLLPLLRSTLENLYTNDPARALTGTFARADTATVRRHLAALRGVAMPEALAAYQLLGRRSLRLAKAAGASSGALKAIEQALKKQR
ncbi:MAG: hypothetical protein QOJ52_4362 [Acidimicrobiaceae bacterium]|jgi:predicted short-subunit dehydrogenase-like oxidoreductase (DUF2520 family)|nr:hypothetical protein [Acidimicrobiaceae bacterium]